MDQKEHLNSKAFHPIRTQTLNKNLYNIACFERPKGCHDLECNGTYLRNKAGVNEQFETECFICSH